MNHTRRVGTQKTIHMSYLLITIQKRRLSKKKDEFRLTVVKIPRSRSLFQALKTLIS